MRRNPSKPKMGERKGNFARSLETIRVEDLRYTLANFDYAHMLKLNWCDFDSGRTKRAI